MGQRMTKARRAGRSQKGASAAARRRSLSEPPLEKPRKASKPSPLWRVDSGTDHLQVGSGLTGMRVSSMQELNTLMQKGFVGGIDGMLHHKYMPENCAVAQK